MKLSSQLKRQSMVETDRLRFPVIESLLETGAVEETLEEIGRLNQHLEDVDSMTFDPSFKRTCQTARDGLSNVSELLEHLRSLSTSTTVKTGETEDISHV